MKEIFITSGPLGRMFTGIRCVGIPGDVTTISSFHALPDGKSVIDSSSPSYKKVSVDVNDLCEYQLSVCFDVVVPISTSPFTLSTVIGLSKLSAGFLVGAFIFSLRCGKISSRISITPASLIVVNHSCLFGKRYITPFAPP